MLGLLTSLFYFCLLFSLATSSAAENDAVVVTSSGPVKGKRLLVDSGTVTAYLGIPYAEPPLGKLRFQKPHPHQPWSQVLEANNYGNSCPQFIFLGFPDAAIWAANTPLSEDCLFLNIWVPHPQPSTPAPVMVWIHGGGFITGTASLDVYNGASLAATEKVIVVSLNYRLGVLGFLSLPPDAPGNMGLLDQQLALRWVKENAAAFGGDPSRVTMFGHSAGAASVGLHLLSPGSQPLFAQAVLQSGTPGAVWAWMSPEVAKQRALALSQLLGCPQGNDSVVVSCLQQVEAAKFAPYELSKMASELLLDLPFSPTTDGEFLPDEPQKLLGSGHIQAKSILIGATANEGTTFVRYSFPEAVDGLLTWEQLLKAVKMTVRRATEPVIQAVALKYSEEDRGIARYRWAMSQLCSDYFFVCPVAEIAAKVAEAGNPVYAYLFTHHTPGSFWPEWIGAPHGAELPYLFGTLASVLRPNQTYTEAEAALSRKMMRYWAGFARNGNPTGSAASEVQWPLYNATEQNFFHLGTEPPQVVQTSPARYCGFLEAQKAAQPNKAKGDPVSPSKEEDGKESITE
ncbi:cholinesterase-like [Hemicordylus capensis]|uniref:cholinesterase-like n=1 Tax=Hemicordylus capensis TaxID=884348 RepID=UPI0023021592|nr:cholinesterase-like [Hemicordylus capensis]